MSSEPEHHDPDSLAPITIFKFNHDKMSRFGCHDNHLMVSSESFAGHDRTKLASKEENFLLRSYGFVDMWGYKLSFGTSRSGIPQADAGLQVESTMDLSCHHA